MDCLNVSPAVSLIEYSVPTFQTKSFWALKEECMHGCFSLTNPNSQFVEGFWIQESRSRTHHCSEKGNMICETCNWSLQPYTSRSKPEGLSRCQDHAEQWRFPFTLFFLVRDSLGSPDSKDPWAAQHKRWNLSIDPAGELQEGRVLLQPSTITIEAIHYGRASMETTNPRHSQQRTITEADAMRLYFLWNKNKLNNKVAVYL